MPKKHTKDIYEYLFNEGVLVAKKDVHLAKHPLITTVPNLHVMKCLQVRLFDLLAVRFGTIDFRALTGILSKC